MQARSGEKIEFQVSISVKNMSPNEEMLPKLLGKKGLLEFAEIFYFLEIPNWRQGTLFNLSPIKNVV